MATQLVKVEVSVYVRVEKSRNRERTLAAMATESKARRAVQDALEIEVGDRLGAVGAVVEKVSFDAVIEEE